MNDEEFYSESQQIQLVSLKVDDLVNKVNDMAKNAEINQQILHQLSSLILNQSGASSTSPKISVVSSTPSNNVNNFNNSQESASSSIVNNNVSNVNNSVKKHFQKNQEVFVSFSTPTISKSSENNFINDNGSTAVNDNNKFNNKRRQSSNILLGCQLRLVRHLVLNSTGVCSLGVHD